MAKSMRLAPPLWGGAAPALAALAAGERGWATDAGGGGAQATAQTCRTAEINPVTGHVLCTDPLRAPVEEPPASTELPCRPTAGKGDGAWTWGPNCKCYTE
jgi:hypothetical protein